ncbi:MAG: hypothetical protein SFV32_09290 [Opitutaceae bacterium]|nr:hypothetical protein [Opitutaceae bacterium]
MTELEASLEVGAGKSGKPKKARLGTSLSRTIALEIAPHIQSNPLSIKALRTHLRVAAKASELGVAFTSSQELASRQNQVLERLFSEEKAKVVQAEQEVAKAKQALAEAKVEIAHLTAQLTAVNQQKDMQQGISEMRLKDALVQQRADLRFQLRNGLENIRLYTDRSEAAKDRVLKLCDELISKLDGTTNLP